MAKSMFVVKSNPLEAREDEYNDWYDNQHVSEVLAVPGFVSAQRFVLADMNANEVTVHRYLAIYEIEGDLGSALAALRSAAPGMHISSALEPGSESLVYTELEGAPRTLPGT